VKRVKLTLGIRESEMLLAMAEQMLGDMMESPQACGYTPRERDQFINACKKLTKSINESGGFK